MMGLKKHRFQNVKQAITLINDSPSYIELNGAITRLVEAIPVNKRRAFIQHLGEYHPAHLVRAAATSNLLFSFIYDLSFNPDETILIFEDIIKLSTAQYIFSVRNADGHTILQAAIGFLGMYKSEEYSTIVEYLLSQPIDFSNHNKYGKTVLHQLLSTSQKYFIKYIHVIKSEMKNFSSEINHKDNDGRSPLLLAATSRIVVSELGVIKRSLSDEHLIQKNSLGCDVELLKLLFELGVDVNITNQHGFTALHFAAIVGSSKGVKFFLEQGANPNAMTNFGLCPIDLLPSCQHRNMLENILLDAGATPSPKVKINAPSNDKLLQSIVGMKKLTSQLRLNKDEREQLKKIKKDITDLAYSRKINVTSQKYESTMKPYSIEKINTVTFFETKNYQHIRAQRRSTLTQFQKLPDKSKASLETMRSEQTPVIQKNKLGWSLLQHRMKPKQLGRYLDTFDTVSMPVGDIELEFVDLREADDYQFIVSTIMSDLKTIQELIDGEISFFNSTPYISGSLIDKVTRGFAGGHRRSRLMFPIHLALEVPAEAMQYAGPTDIDSPYNCLATYKLCFLNKLFSKRNYMDIRLAKYQTRSETPLPPTLAISNLEDDSEYVEPTDNNLGCSPLYTPEFLLRSTKKPTTKKRAYNELIITTNAFSKQLGEIKPRLLLVEQHFLDEFNTKHNRFKAHEMLLDDVECIDQMLQLLKDLEAVTDGRLRLAVIKTDTLGYKQKMPIEQQIQKEFIPRKQKQLDKLRKLYIGKKRLESAGLIYKYRDKLNKELENLEDLLQCQRDFESLLAPEIERGDDTSHVSIPGSRS